jgi:glycosyltransferase involved in cell wall biosynthesis
VHRGDLISFIVPAYNEEKSLAATLGAIHAAARECRIEYEVVVADDASTDATAAIAAANGARVVHVDHRQIARTRNSGARAAAGDRLIFVDADTLVDAALIAEALAALRAGAVGGGAMPLFDAAAPSWAHRSLTLVAWTMRTLRLAAGCFVFCLRAPFEAVGGFDERHFAGEEIMLSWALRRHGRFVILRGRPVTSARKSAGMSLGQFLRLCFRLTFRGMGALRKREGNEFWYDGKR